MSVDSNVVPGISPRRQKRWASKKRKVEAFLNLIQSSETEEVSEAKKLKLAMAKSKGQSLEEEVRCLRKVQELIRRKEQEPEPSFFLTEHGLKAQVNFVFYNKDKPPGQTQSPLFVEDVQHLILKALLGNASMCNTRWCKLVRERSLSHVLLFVIDGLSKDKIIQNVSHFPNMLEIFNDMVEVLTPDSYSLRFATELCGVHLSIGHHSQAVNGNPGLGTCTSFKPLSTMFPTENDSKESSGSKDYSKLHLLLSPIQLVMENFPLPQSVFEGSKSDGYCFTKKVYSHVTPKSPLFALDCEMCRMRSGRMEVTRIAMINEDFEVVMNTLVKPEGEVVDYLTKYSGVTAAMLSSVKTSLGDVQRKIQSILPADAILCGQSLNFDLHALKMIHPYVIDTSVIYNTSGCRTKKVGLRVLSNMFLNETIQVGEKGHDPIEDCFATMKLVKLKLENGPQFGDAILSGRGPFMSTIQAYAKNSSPDDKASEPKNNSDAETRPKKNNELSTSFFSKLQNLKKTVCIVADKNCQSQYSKDMLTSCVNQVTKPDIKKVIKHSVKSVGNYNLTICHIDMSDSKLSSEVYAAVDNYVRRLYIACSEKGLFVTVATGLLKKNENDIFENGLCMVKVKNEKPKWS